MLERGAELPVRRGGSRKAAAWAVQKKGNKVIRQKAN